MLVPATNSRHGDWGIKNTWISISCEKIEASVNGHESIHARESLYDIFGVVLENKQNLACSLASRRDPVYQVEKRKMV